MGSFLAFLFLNFQLASLFLPRAGQETHWQSRAAAATAVRPCAEEGERSAAELLSADCLSRKLLLDCMGCCLLSALVPVLSPGT